MRIKILGAAVSVTTANNVQEARAVAVTVNSDTTVTIRTSAGQIIGSIVLKAGVYTIEKAGTDTIEASAAVSCTKVALR